MWFKDICLATGQGSIITLAVHKVFAVPSWRLVRPFTFASDITGDPSNFESHVPPITYRTLPTRGLISELTRCWVNSREKLHETPSTYSLVESKRGIFQHEQKLLPTRDHKR